MDLKYATASVNVTVDGQRYNLTLGEAWDADDPVVKAHPSAFSDRPPFARATDRGLVGWKPVESATDRPGERRNTRR